MTEQRGFTIMETVVTAGIVAVVLSATIGVLARYTDTDVRTQKMLRAQHLAQAEVDEVKARHAVENSLASDDEGRSRTFVMEDLKYQVSQYYFYNFPIAFPAGNYPFNHGQAGSIDKATLESLFFFTNPDDRLRNALGGRIQGDTPVYTLRYQLLGIEAGITSEQLHLLLNLTSDNPLDPTDPEPNPLKRRRITAAQQAGLYNNPFWIPGTADTAGAPKGANVYNPLIADSSPSVALNGGWAKNVRRFKMPYDGYKHFVSKVLIVRVYDQQDPNREIGRAYGVLTGRVQL